MRTKVTLSQSLFNSRERSSVNGYFTERPRRYYPFAEFLFPAQSIQLFSGISCDRYVWSIESHRSRIYCIETQT